MTGSQGGADAGRLGIHGGWRGHSAPFYENFGKRIIKSPKTYIADSGVACHLLGIETEAELERSPFRGALFEGFIAAEILKSQVNAGVRRELYYFRDQQGLEVDFLFPGQAGAIRIAEVKATRTPTPDMAEPMRRLSEAMTYSPRTASPRTAVVEKHLVHSPRAKGSETTALSPGVKAVPWKNFIETLPQGFRGR